MLLGVPARQVCFALPYRKAFYKYGMLLIVVENASVSEVMPLGEDGFCLPIDPRV